VRPHRPGSTGLSPGGWRAILRFLARQETATEVPAKVISVFSSHGLRVDILLVVLL
jgi:hypothetical protein